MCACVCVHVCVGVCRCATLTFVIFVQCFHWGFSSLLFNAPLAYYSSLKWCSLLDPLWENISFILTLKTLPPIKSSCWVCKCVCVRVYVCLCVCVCWAINCNGESCNLTKKSLFFRAKDCFQRECKHLNEDLNILKRAFKNNKSKRPALLEFNFIADLQTCLEYLSLIYSKKFTSPFVLMKKFDISFCKLYYF